jgi:hypothetical protein
VRLTSVDTYRSALVKAGATVELAPKFQDNRHMRMAKFSALRPGHLYSQETFLVLFSVRVWVDPTAEGQPEGLCQ